MEKLQKSVSNFLFAESFSFYRMNKSNILLTAQGLEDLKKELDELKNVKLPEVMSRVAKARDDGDLSENAAYQFGRQEAEFLEGRIEELEEIFRNSSLIVQNDKGKKNTVELGCKVTVSTANGKSEFHVVGEWEAKPAEKKISGNSPLGKALLGKKVGEKIEVDAPAGKVVYSIISIE